MKIQCRAYVIIQRATYMLHSSSLCVRALKWGNVCYEAASNGFNSYNVYYCYAYKLQVRNRVNRDFYRREIRK